ncbi:MAG: ATP synthase F0 subunit B [Acidobacteriota bacterium]|jgi:F-type H+-transporting ATPase subunit b|nr:ATP synthase F0 subunit B [Acidobacteriota bacterium]
MENFPHLPTLLSVGAAVFFLMLVLNQFLFKPLRSIIDERERRTTHAQEELQAANVLNAERLDQIENRLKEARREAYDIRDAAQREGRAKRDERMMEARQAAQDIVEKARAELAADVEIAHQDLESEAERLSQVIAEQVLGRPVGPKGGSN